MNINIPETELETKNDAVTFENFENLDNSLSKRTSLDWRDYDVVTPVKYQGYCASCWAFSAVGAVESCQAIKTGNLVNLSEQELIDCTYTLGNDGCSSGSVVNSYFFIYGSGLCTNASYPYHAYDQRCMYGCSSVDVITGYVSVRPGNETDLLDMVNIAPVSVVIDASLWSFQFYSSGVYYDPECSSSAINHGMLVVGYGTSYGSDFWTAKNSWGTSWGEEGYIYFSRNMDNNCGIASSGTLPTC